MTSPANSVRRRLVVHVGLPKTGSTSFHHFLRRNAQALAPLLVVPSDATGIRMRPLGRAAIAYSLMPDQGNEARLRGAIADILAALPQDDLPVLLSHENLAGAMPGNGGETALFPFLPHIARILIEEARGFDTQIVYYSRLTERWLESVWAQAVRTDGYQRDWPEFRAETSDIPDWDDLTARIAGAIGADRVTRLRVEDEADLLRPGQSLLRLAGLSQSQLDVLHAIDHPAMTRLNPGALEFMRQLNATQLNPHARARIADLVARSQPLFNAEYRPQGSL